MPPAATSRSSTGLRGPNFCVSSACASGNHTIGEAFWNILPGTKRHHSHRRLRSRSYAYGTWLVLCGPFAEHSKRQSAAASRPFDRDRDGFVLAEGAGILILEEYEHAKKRGANIYAELLGYGATDDGYHITAPLPDGSGAAATMELALADAGIEKDKVDYINAHGTGTELNDIAESTAIKTVFGQHAYEIPVSSTKSCLGHQLGASAAVEMIYV